MGDDGAFQRDDGLRLRALAASDLGRKLDVDQTVGFLRKRMLRRRAEREVKSGRRWSAPP